METAAFRRDLLAWYDAHQRDLPWRRPERASDPYAVWVSEVMLQQTRVETVLRYYEPWMERFPTVQDLAEADDDDVLAVWTGLGYYRRARALHAAARMVAREGVPQDAAAWAGLPGIGPYTAAAIASIAQDEPVAVVDGNVERVASRLAALTQDLTKAAGRNAVKDRADAWLDRARPGDWNQAMMELGALVCAPVPRCQECPVSAHCKALAQGVQGDLPRRTPKRPPVPEDVHFGLVMSDGRLLLVKRPDDGLLAGTWALPGGATQRSLQSHILDQASLQVQVSEMEARAKHVFTHRVWHMRVRTCHVLDVDPSEPRLEVRWVPLNRLETLGLSTAMKKALGAAGLPVP